ncbi:hypothetical protein F5X96DRAFT_689216 [Biscogniauxia mediterranea]|nr:hypothetical protein F5X96DRAFT_689216 [Biscogniauxia mediterranea]
MCWGNKGHYHCYECQREFDHYDGFTPCYKHENGIACGKLIPRPEAVQTGQNCDQCKAARAAEEMCQQQIHRQKPMVLFDRRDRARVWAATYEADLAARKEAARQRKAKAEAEKKKRLAENPEAKPEAQPPQGEQTKQDDEDYTPAPPFITMRHQCHA